jgi:hypothetical protein
LLSSYRLLRFPSYSQLRTVVFQLAALQCEEVPLKKRGILSENEIIRMDVAMITTNTHQPTRF